MLEGEVVTCADPDARSEARFDRSLAPPEPPKTSRFWAGGVIVADLTGDGLVDIVLPGYWGTTFHAGQPDGTWLQDDRLAGMGLNLGTGGSAADYDGDGDLDLLVTRFLAPDKLLNNQGGLFTDVSEAAGILVAMRRSMASTWGDYDGDGDLDLFVGCYGFIDESGTVEHEDFLPADPAFLYRNEGDGTFSDQSASLPQSVHDGYTFVAAWIDLVGDPLPELYVVNDFGVAYPNVLLRNEGGALVPDDGALRLNVDITGMGLGIGDLNEDGGADFVMPEWNGIVTMESSEIGTWVQTGMARGILNDVTRSQKVGWGAELQDLDNDGDLDVPVAFGFLASELYDAPQDQPDALFEQGADGLFTDQGPAWGFADPTDGRGFVVADLDGNGWLDVVRRDLQGPTLLDKARCGDGHWSRLRLAQDGPNRFAIGARVRVYSEGRRMMRWVMAGGTSHASSGPPEVHVGLGEAERLRRVEITWPDGAVSNLWDLPADRVLTVVRAP